MMQKIKTYFGEARQELKHVNWPGRNEAIRLTAVVILLALFLSIFLGAFDYIFTYILRVFFLKI